MLEPRNPNPCATLIGQKAGPLPPPLPHTPTLYTNLGPEHARGGRAGGMDPKGGAVATSRRVMRYARVDAAPSRGGVEKHRGLR